MPGRKTIDQVKPAGKKCEGREGVIKEAVLGLGIIGAGSRLEHYETAISLGELIGLRKVAIRLSREHDGHLRRVTPRQRASVSPLYFAGRAHLGLAPIPAFIGGDL